MDKLLIGLFYFLSVTVCGNFYMLWFGKCKVNVRTIIEIIVLNIMPAIFDLYIGVEFGENVAFMIYPLVVHLPLALYYLFRMKCHVWQVIFSLMFAYMLSTLQKWIAYAIVFAFGDVLWIQLFAFTIAALIMLILVGKFVSPKIVSLYSENKSDINVLCIPAILYYVTSYVSTVYSDLLYDYPTLSAAFLSLSYAIAFTIFEIFYFNYRNRQLQNKHLRDLFDLQTRSIKRLGKYYKTNVNLCKNDIINNILSIYAAEGKSNNIQVLFELNIPLLGKKNETEEALIISQLMDDALRKAQSYIQLTVFEKQNQLCIMSEADCKTDFDPLTIESISACLQKYNGTMLKDEKIYKVQMLADINR